MHDSILALHILAGSVALTSMCIPMFAPKGRTLHRRAGWVFVCSMAAMSITAVALGGWLLLTPDDERGMRLLLLAAVTVNSVSAGVRVLRTKSRTQPHRNAWDLGLPLFLLVVSGAGAVFGVHTGAASVIGAGAFGFALAAVDLRYWLSAPGAPMHWWLRHMYWMLAAGWFAANAFASNLTNLGIWPGSVVATSLVAGVGLPGIGIWLLYYRRKFSQRQ